ncbi:hypothetical protein [Ornithinicoccus halotolerans]|uniref:hypothetical protein n=1 Tax=Ornithinicoccus halotolerans TaxID=1748220 RepID=UPI001294B871|nr:hypothetical protein [Ornithinicoccus halotolerans]
MLVIGLILIVLSLAVVAYVWFATVDLSAITVDLGAFSVLMTPLHLFLAGGATVLVLALGAALFASGLRGRRRRRRELKDLRTRAAERDQLRAEREAAGQEHHDRDATASTDPTREHTYHRDPTVPEATRDDSYGERRDPHRRPARDDTHE